MSSVLRTVIINISFVQFEGERGANSELIYETNVRNILNIDYFSTTSNVTKHNTTPKIVIYVFFFSSTRRFMLGGGMYLARGR